MVKDERARPFILSWRAAVLNSQLPSSAKLPLLALAEFADLDGRSCYPSIARVAELSSQNERTVRRQLDAAELNGWFSRQTRGTSQGWRRYEYTLHIPQGADTAPARPASGADTESAPSTPTCGLSVPNVRTLSTERAGTESDDLSITYPIPREEQKHSRFAEFWALYPRKDAKAKAASAWTAKKLDTSADQILSDIRARLSAGVWTEVQFVPHATTYLNGRRWEDEWQTSVHPQHHPLSKTGQAFLTLETMKSGNRQESRPQRLQRELKRIRQEEAAGRRRCGKESLVERAARRAAEDIAVIDAAEDMSTFSDSDFIDVVFSTVNSSEGGR